MVSSGILKSGAIPKKKKHYKKISEKVEFLQNTVNRSRPQREAALFGKKLVEAAASI